MNPKTYLTLGAIAASCALPASASAATASASASASVSADVSASVQAFEKVKVLTEAGRDGAATTKLRVGLRELRDAARTTARMRMRAETDAAFVRVVSAERRIGQSAALSADVLADVVAEASVSAQLSMAKAISDLLVIHRQAIGTLTQTIDEASDAVDAVAVKAIAELSANANGVVSAIGEAQADVSVSASLKLTAALQVATGTASSSLAILRTISANASATVRASVDQAISQVTGALVQTQVALQALISTVAAMGAEASAVLPTLQSALGSVSVALSADAQVHAGAGAGVTGG